MFLMDKGLASLVCAFESDGDVLAVVVYGSVARGERYRDVDVCIVLDSRTYSDLELSEKKLAFQSKVSSDVDVQVFQQLPPYIQQRVLADGDVVFCRDFDRLYDLSFLAVKKFEDLAPIYRSYLEGVKDAG